MRIWAKYTPNCTYIAPDAALATLFTCSDMRIWAKYTPNRIYLAFGRLFTARACVFEHNKHQTVSIWSDAVCLLLKHGYLSEINTLPCILGFLRSVYSTNMRIWMKYTPIRIYLVFCGLFTARTCVFEGNIHQFVYIWLSAACLLLGHAYMSIINTKP
jgi:hypothetical protein